MTEQGIIDVVGQILALVGVVIAAGLANTSRRHAKAARIQVENNHRDEDGNVINLREEADERHDENKVTLAVVVKMLTGVQSDIRGIRRDVGRLYDADEAIRADLEDTKGGIHHGRSNEVQ